MMIDPENPPSHLDGGVMLYDTVADLTYGDCLNTPQGTHGAMTMDISADVDAIKSAIAQKFVNEGRMPGFTINIDNIYFRTFNNIDGTMSVVFQVD
jgi:hypothetical protein